VAKTRSIIGRIGFGGLCGLLAVCNAPALASTPFELQVLTALNHVRENPDQLISSLRRYRQFFHANIVSVPGSKADLVTSEGVAPVDEAINFLSRHSSLVDLQPATLLAASASDLRQEQSRDGSVGHIDAAGMSPGDRARDHGGDVFVSEVIAYGATDPEEVVRQLIVDDGVPDRGHRTVIFDRSLRFAGVSCGPHPVYRTMCVIDLAVTEDGSTPLGRSRRPNQQVAALREGNVIPVGFYGQ
jgi:uncharacterized protein YkwD